MRTIREILIHRDKMTPAEADKLISMVKEDLYDRLKKGETPENICAEWFGLEPDYLEELAE